MINILIKKTKDPVVCLCANADECDSEYCKARIGIPVNGEFKFSELKHCLVLDREISIEYWTRPRKKRVKKNESNTL